MPYKYSFFYLNSSSANKFTIQSTLKYVILNTLNIEYLSLLHVDGKIVGKP